MAGRGTAQVPQLARAFATQRGRTAEGLAVVTRLEVAVTNDLAVLDRVEAIKPLRLIQRKPLPDAGMCRSEAEPGLAIPGVSPFTDSRQEKDMGS